MRVDLFLSLRLVRDARAQSALIAAGVAVGVAIVVFLSSLISGLQADLIAKTVGSQPHLVVEPPDEKPRALYAPRAGDGTVVLSRVEQVAQRVRSLDGWQQRAARFGTLPGVTAVSPIARGPAFAVRGTATTNITLIGVEPARFLGVVDVESKLLRGRFATDSQRAVIGARLARDLGIDVGDKLRVQTSDGSSAVFDVGGVFELGTSAADEGWVIVSLRNGQSLLDVPGGATAIELSVSDVFAAESLAERIRRESGLKVESWMERNAQLLAGLRSQSASSWIIQIFVFLAVAIGIASVLVVSVSQRSREIGILRAMGLSRRRVQRVFLFQGALLGLVGAGLGVLLGGGLVALFAKLPMTAGRTFPIAVSRQSMLFVSGVAILISVVAASYPARRAARLDPVVAIRND